MLQNTKAFTLSELLISLSVLGLIAALTLPAVFNSVEQQRKKAVFKETINALQNALYSSAMDGQILDPDNFMSRLSLAKQCTTNTDCRTTTSIGVHTTPKGGIFHNGAHFWDVEPLLSNWGAGGVALDYNGPEGPNTEGQDIIAIAICMDETNTSSNSCNFYLERPINGAIGPNKAFTNSVALWNEIFGAS